MLQVSSKQAFDAIVVGSGISGGWAAKELTEKGLRVLLLELGKPIEHIKDYKYGQTHPWELPHRGRLTLASKAKFPIQTSEGGYPITEANEHFWLPEASFPYQQKRPFDWYRGSGVGGKSLVWGRHVYRWSDANFEANAKEGIGIDWPIRYKDIAPWYAYVEKFIGVTGESLGLSHVPDSVFQPPMPLNCIETHFREQVKQNFPQRHVTSGRVAHLTQPTAEQTELGRSACQYRNACTNGCPYGAYFSSQSATLPAAQRTGRLTVRPHTVVRHLVFDKTKQRCSGVMAIDTETKETLEFSAKLVFLCASTLGSTKILLQSVKEGLPINTDSLGRYLMDHQSRVGASGNFDLFADQYYKGRRPNGIFIPQFRNVGADKRDYLRGFNYQGNGGRSGKWTSGDEFGAIIKQKRAELGNWHMSLTAFGEVLPYENNRIYLHETAVDSVGLPQLVVDAALAQNEALMRKDMAQDAAEMLASAGATEVKTYDNRYAMGLSKHEMGTARMGREAATSVLNANNQVWECKNVFVTDGACMTSSNCVNPSLTYMALTARACHFAAEALQRGDL